MNTRLVGWFFCALFCSSFAHDWLRGQASLLEAKANKLNRADSKLVDTIDKIARSNDDLERQESVQLRSGTGTVQYYCSSNRPDLLVIFHSVLKVAIAIDLTANIIALLDGSGTCVLFNNNSGICHYVPVGGWDSIQVDLLVWLAVTDFLVLEALVTNIVVNILNPGQNVINVCVNIAAALDATLNIQVLTNLNNCLNLIISISVNIITHIKVDLHGLIKLTTAVPIDLTVGLCGFVEILGGLVELLTVYIDINILIVAGIILEITAILQATDGMSCFAYIIDTIRIKIDLSLHFQSVINNITILLHICIRLGGGVYTGITGVIQVVATVLAFLDGTVTLEACLLIIINVCACANSQINIIVVLDLLLSVIIAQNAQWNCGNCFAPVIIFINALKSGTYIVANVNICQIINLLCIGVVTTVLTLCVEIVVCLTAYITVDITIELYYATLFKVIIFLLNDIPGRFLLNILFPGLNISIVYSNVCLNLLAGLTVLLSTVLLILSTLGLVAAIALVPILATIYNTCFSVIQNKTGLQLNVILQSASASGVYALLTVFMNGITACGC